MKQVYHGDGVVLTPAAKKQVRQLTELGYGDLPICMAKTQYSFSDDQSLLGAPDGFTVTVRNVKVSAGAGFLADLIPRAHDRGVKVILSHHNFSRTPELSAMLDTLARMEQSGGDILKIAVMPQSPEDVLTLLSATSQARARFTRPVVTMSMAGMGVISRLSGEVFGSALTFGSAGQASAPGQIGVEELRGMLELLHQNL